MIDLREMQVKQEQYQDIMRRAEQRRLLKSETTSTSRTGNTPAAKGRTKQCFAARWYRRLGLSH